MDKQDVGAPVRHPLDWESPDFYDKEKLDEEMRRIFDVCHGCRRCFNLCDSFPRLFDLVDDSATGELDSVDSAAFKPVVDACTLCDMCFINKCPYVPPHPYQIDFPHLMLRYRAVETKEKGTPFIKNQLVQMDRNAAIASKLAPVVNWGLDEGNGLARKLITKVVGIHEKAFIPKFQKTTFVSHVSKNPVSINKEAPGAGEKVVLYVTCYGNYHQSSIAEAAYKILKHNGVEVDVVYPGCCGMPLLEQGHVAKVAMFAKNIATAFKPWIEKGHKVITLVPSCSIMLKQEWPLLLRQNDDVQRLSHHTVDVCDYLVQLFKTKGLASGMNSLDDDITLHLACHSRAQNMGAKAAEMLRFIPNIRIDVIERCSGHGGSWGMMVDHFETALKLGKFVFKQVIQNNNGFVASECPLAGEHIRQGVETMAEEKSSRGVEGPDSRPLRAWKHAHPLEILAYAFGLVDLSSQ